MRIFSRRCKPPGGTRAATLAAGDSVAEEERYSRAISGDANKLDKRPKGMISMRILLNTVTAVALFAAATMAQAGCFRCLPIQNVVDEAVVGTTGKKPTEEQVKGAIIRAGLALGWQMKDAGPGLVKATLILRKHQADIEIPYTADKYSITYKSSSNLDWSSDGQIHKNYNGWIQNLTKGINAQLSTI